MGDAQGKLEFTSDISESSIRQWLSLPRADPRRLFYVHCLELGTGSRFLSSRQQGDYGQSIINLTKAIYFPHTRDTPSSFPNIVKIFYYLTLALFFRVTESRRPEDVKSCIRYFRYLHGQWHEVSMKFRLPVATALVHALAVQVELELGDVDQDIEEMADLCDELLSSDISTRSLADPIMAFALVTVAHFTDPPEWKICPEKVTDCLRKTIVRHPGLHNVSIALAKSLHTRFVVAPSDDDYEEGMAIVDRMLTFCGSGDEPSPLRRHCAGRPCSPGLDLTHMGSQSIWSMRSTVCVPWLMGLLRKIPIVLTTSNVSLAWRDFASMAQQIPKTRCPFLQNLQSFHHSVT